MAGVPSSGPGRTERLHLGVTQGGIEHEGVEVFESFERVGGDVFLVGVGAEGVEGGGGDIMILQYGEELFAGGVHGCWLAGDRHRVAGCWLRGGHGVRGLMD